MTSEMGTYKNRAARPPASSSGGGRRKCAPARSTINMPTTAERHRARTQRRECAGLDPGQVLGLDVSCCVLFQLGFQ